MKVDQSAALPPALKSQLKHLGKTLVKLRHALRMKQAEAALRAGISRASALRIEKGDPGVAIGIIIRYLDAIVPGKTLLSLLSENDPALLALEARLQKHRVRGLTKKEQKELDF